ncbi:MAG: CPBP family intramembrane glutamic endopeptidase [Rhodanobacter sp.]
MEVRSAEITPLPAPSTFTDRASPPGLGRATGLIAGYFALQLLTGFVFALAIMFVTTLNQSAHDLEMAIGRTLSQPDMQAWLAIASLGVAAPVTLGLAYRHWQPWWSMGSPPGLGFTPPTSTWFLALAIAIGLLLPWLGALLTQWLADGHPLTQEIQQIGGQTPLAPRMVLVLVVVCVGPVVEELLFRGILLSSLMRRWRAGWAVALSSLVFALIHLPGLDYQWYAVPNLLLLAVLLAILRLASKSIWPPVLAHGINNLVAVASWFIAVKAAG